MTQLWYLQTVHDVMRQFNGVYSYTYHAFVLLTRGGALLYWWTCAFCARIEGTRIVGSWSIPVPVDPIGGRRGIRVTFENGDRI